MSYDTRTRRIFAFLFDKEPAGLLRGYAAPDHLSQDRRRDEINSLVEDINREIPSECTDDAMTLLLPEIKIEVRRRHGARGWPPSKIMVASTVAAIEAMKSKADKGGNIEEVAIAGLTNWYHKFGDCFAKVSSETRTHEMINRGVFTAREARVAGFPLSKHDRFEAESQPMSQVEIDRSIRVYSGIWGIDKQATIQRLKEEGMVPIEQLEQELSRLKFDGTEND